MLDDPIDLRDVGRILTVIADPPNVRTEPRVDDLQGDFDEWFDDGARRIVTGYSSYQFQDGSTAEVPNSLMLNVSITLPSGARVVVRQEDPTTP